MFQVSGQDFAIMAANALVAAGVDGQKLSFDPDKFDLIMKDDYGRPVNTVHLGRFYERYRLCSHAVEQEQVFRQIQLLAKPPAVPSTLAEAAPNLRVTARLRFHYGNDVHPHLLVGNHLVLLVAHDSPETISFISHGDLERWQVSFHQVLELAMDNVEKATNFKLEKFSNRDNDQDVVYKFFHDDNYGAGRLVFTAALESAAVLGDRVVVIPDRSNILMTGSDCIGGLGMMLDWIREANERGRLALCPTLLLLRNDDYFSVQLPKAHPLYREFRLLELEFEDWLYQEQRQKLADGFDAVTGKVSYVSYRLKKDRETPFSICNVMDDGIWRTNSIPKTDYVFFSNRHEPLAICTWEKMVSVMRDKITRIESYPVRYEINQFPDSATLQLLGLTPMPE